MAGLLAVLSGPAAAEESRLRVVTSVAPIADLVARVGGDAVAVDRKSVV